MSKKKSKNDKNESKKFLLILGVLLILGFSMSYFFYMSTADNYSDSSCSTIADSQLRADCYTQLAKTTGEVGYCINTNYWFEECLEISDPNHAANSETLQEVCEAVSDSSKREECFEYVENNY